MRRLLILPAVGALSVAVWWSGLVWPIATQAWSVIAPRPATGDTEDDVIA